ncbi:MAG: TIGR04190 family B12-binding domain/radical SAM domain protein [Nitrososphaerales archaeon]|nr:TIGR04190 family B12-binding domain/radical SAM domain protein [Nitrososphaerales archaeon]
MRRKDLILIHPPSIFDFRKKPILWGPISDTVPSTPIFEMYPIGFMTIANYLHRNHYSVEIVNLAVRMMKDAKFDVVKYLSSLKAKVFGIDFHWLPHVQGSLKVAHLLKKLHPDVPIVMGGLSATYYAQEILENFPQIDFIVKGDSGEEPLLCLLREIERGKEEFSSVPNLSWRDREGRIHHNPITYVPDSLDHLNVDKWFLASFILKGRFNANHAPYYLWDKAPIGAILTCKGCIFNCVTCGGSCYTYSEFYSRRKIAFRSPKNLVEDLSLIDTFIRIPVYILGDIRQAGNRYVEEFLSRLRDERIDLPIIFELFTPAPKDFINSIARSVPDFGFSLSPESADPEVRRAQGRYYTNDAIERTIVNSLEAGASRFDLFFMLGLGKESEQSVQTTFDYCLKLTKSFYKKNFYTFLSTLTPSLDPGSQAFEYPSIHGFRLRYKTLLEHYHAYSMPSWAYFINYSTQNFSSNDIVELTYRVAYFTAELRRIHTNNKEEVDLIKSRIDASRLILRKIDEIMQIKDDVKREEELQRLTNIVQSDGGSRIVHTLEELLREF